MVFATLGASVLTQRTLFARSVFIVPIISKHVRIFTNITFLRSPKRFGGIQKDASVLRHQQLLRGVWISLENQKKNGGSGCWIPPATVIPAVPGGVMLRSLHATVVFTVFQHASERAKFYKEVFGEPAKEDATKEATTKEASVEDYAAASADLIAQRCDKLKNLLFEKNRKYGDSALNPLRCFSKASPIEQLKVRIDDKLSRIRNGSLDEDEDVVMDLAGYCILYMIATDANEGSLEV